MKPRSGKKKTKAPKAAKEPRKKSAAPINTKTGKGGDAATSKVMPSEVRRLIPKTALVDLMKVCRGLKANMDSINGELREKIAYAKDKKHLNTKAFGWLRQLDKMEPEKLAGFWDDLLAYMDMAGINERIESVGKLPLEQRAADDDDADETEAKPAPKPRAAKPKAEPAGEPAQANGGDVSKPHFGQPAASKAPGGEFVLLDDKRPATTGH